jgi:hypothetical protein
LHHATTRTFSKLANGHGALAVGAVVVAIETDLALGADGLADGGCIARGNGSPGPINNPDCRASRRSWAARHRSCQHIGRGIGQRAIGALMHQARAQHQHSISSSLNIKGGSEARAQHVADAGLAIDMRASAFKSSMSR